MSKFCLIFESIRVISEDLIMCSKYLVICLVNLKLVVLKSTLVVQDILDQLRLLTVYLLNRHGLKFFAEGIEVRR